MIRPPWLVAALLTVSVMAGCIGDDPTSSQADGDNHEHAADDVMEVRIPEGASDPDHDGVWFALDAGSFEAPAILRFINDDTAFHRVVGESTSPKDQRPAWVDAHGHSDDHGYGGETAGGHHGHSEDNGPPNDGHEHAGIADGESVFDVLLGPGDQKDVHIDRSGLIAIHCRPHPWMVDEWDALPEQAESHDVTVHDLILSGDTGGDLRMGHEGDNEAALNVSLSAPNLASLQVLLTWDDEEDDGHAGESANEPDAFRLTLMDSEGNIAAEETLEARSGELRVAFIPEDLAWPESVQGRSPTEARERLNETHPDDETWVGTWTVEVELLHAPGYLPPDMEDGGTLHDAPGGQGFDGHQTWMLNVISIHEWATLDTEPTEVFGDLHFDDEGAGHEH